MSGSRVVCLGLHFCKLSQVWLPYKPNIDPRLPLNIKPYTALPKALNRVVGLNAGAQCEGFGVEQ